MMCQAVAIYPQNETTINLWAEMRKIIRINSKQDLASTVVWLRVPPTARCPRSPTTVDVEDVGRQKEHSQLLPLPPNQ